MKDIKIVKSPTTIHGRTLKFGAVYGKIDGITYVVEHYDLHEIGQNILTFEFWREREIIHTKKHGDYIRGGYWQKAVSINKGKYANIVKTAINFIRSYSLWQKQPTPYVRNAEIRESGAPKRKLPQNELVFRCPYAGYAVSSKIITDADPMRKIRPGVYYNPA